MVIRVRRGSLAFWLLTRRLATTEDGDRAARSRFSWLDADGIYYLRVIGVLNGLFGVKMGDR